MADYKKGYGTKPWWFWVLVYVIIGGVIYYAIYYFAYGRGGKSYPTPYQNSSGY